MHRFLLLSAMACSLLFLLCLPWAFLEQRLTWPTYERLAHLGLLLTLTLAIAAIAAAITARRGYLPALGLALVAAAILAGRSSALGALLLLAILGLSPFVLLATWAIVTIRRSQPLTAADSLRAIALAILPAVYGLFAGQLIAAADSRAATLYCEDLVAALDQHHERLGNYPEDLSSLQLGVVEPRRLRDGPPCYRSDRESFTFTVPAGWFSGLTFDSKERSWVVVALD